MLKRFQQVSFLLLGLFVAYLLIVRLFISWAQLAPEQFFSFAEKLTDSVINVDTLMIDQSWLGLSYEVKDLSFDNRLISVRLKQAKGDFNIFSPIFPDVPIGRQIDIRGLSVRAIEVDSKAGDDSENFNWERLSLNDYWKVVKLSDVSFEVSLKNKPVLKGGVESFQSYRGVKWSYGGVVWFSLGESLQSRAQLQGDFSLSIWGHPQDGNGAVSILSPLPLQDLYQLMPATWGQKMPDGEMLADLAFELQAGQLSKARITSNAQQLSWPENDDLLPKSIGAGLNWVALDESKGESVLENWQFELEQFRFDNEYIKTISPVKMQLKDSKMLSFSAEKVDFQVLKPFFDIALAKLDYEGFGDNLKQFSLHQVSGELDLHALRMDKLHLEIPEFNLPERQKVPGLVIKDLKIDKKDTNIVLQSEQPLAFQISMVHPDPILMRIPNDLHVTFDRANQFWSVPDAKFSLDGMPVQLKAEGDFSGEVDANIRIQPDKMAFVKDYLPYSLMSGALETWLKTALVDGDGIKGHLKFKGNLNNFPFKDGSGVFKAEAEVHHAILKFQPDWPAVDRFSAKLYFSPYNLKITSSKAMLKKVVGTNVVVDINNLDSSNIAVQIKGDAKADAVDAVDYLQLTPLPKLIGLETFLTDVAKIEGPVSVKLPKIWVPVYGYNKRSETVKGQVSFKDVNLELFERLAFSKVNGKLNFSEKAVTAKKMQGEFQQGNVEVDVLTEEGLVKVLAKGEANLATEFYQGAMPWKTDVVVPLKAKESQDSVSVQVQADITGVTSRLPSPLNEADFQNMPERPALLKGQVRLNGNNIFVDVNVDRLVKTKIQLTTDDLLPSKMSLSIGKSTLSQDLRLVDGLNVRGHLPKLDLDGWLNTWPKLSEHMKLEAPDKEKASNRVWYNSELSFNEVILGDYPFSNVRASWSTIQGKKESELAINVMSNELEAVATRMLSGDVDVKVSKLDIKLPESENKEVNTQKVRDLPAKCRTPQKHVRLPNVHFDGSNIRVNERYLSKLTFDLKDSTEQLKIEDIKIRFGRVNGEATGRYEFNKSQNKSHLKTKIEAKDVEDITKLIGVKKGFQGKKGKVTTDLTWRGDPDCFSIIGLNGKLDFEFKDGSIDQAEPGIARLIGLLSFEALARRLQLNLDDVTSEGLVYDRIQGNGRFRRGIFGFEKLQLDAPAATAKVFGEVNLVQEQFDLSAEITPAIGSTLPAIAAISGVATPIAGLAAYALLKVVPIVNEDLVTYRYEVSGSFDEPVIKNKGLNLDIIQLKGQSSIEEESILDAE